MRKDDSKESQAKSKSNQDARKEGQKVGGDGRLVAVITKDTPNRKD